jgi:hypothetical protein
MIKRLILLILVVFLVFARDNISFSRANFFDEENSPENTMVASCWSPPSIPVLLYPANNTFVGGGSAWDLNPYFDWGDSRLMCPAAGAISYQYEAYSDAGLTTLYYASGWLSNSTVSVFGMPDGTYYWRVRAKDGAGYTSDFSVPWLLTIDRAAPAAPTLSVTGSWLKSVEEKITNGDFANGLTGWTTSGDVATKSSETITGATPSASITVTPLEGTNMVRIGKTSGVSGKMVWENRLMQSFDYGAKSLSLNYNLFSRDWGTYDDPAFFIRLNGQQIFASASAAIDPLNQNNDGKARNTGWQKFYFDLSDLADAGKLNLALYAGNTNDTDNQSWVYIDKVTTYFVSAPAHAIYHLTGGADGVGGSGFDHYEYRVDGGGWQATTDSFPLTTGGLHAVEFKSVDRAGNSSAISLIKVVTDTVFPSTVTDLAAPGLPGVNYVVLTWTAPGNDGTSGRASQYDVRYLPTIDPVACSDFNFDTATKIDKVPAPKNYGEAETLEVLGLNQNQDYCFALKAADEAPNWSGFSNLVAVKTAVGSDINEGDLVINELMWMGTATGSADEYLELRNMTDREILLDNIKLTKLSGDMITADKFTGKKITPKGYFLISNWASSSSALAQSVVSDLVTTSLELSNNALEIKLYNGADLIDTAGNGYEPFEGLFGGGKYYSMERTAVPGLGHEPLNWYTCIDSVSHADFFDTESIGDERGTPGAQNRSENEPLAHQKLLSREPKINLTLSDDKRIATVGAANLTNYKKLSFELIYDSDLAPQGVVGETDLSGDLFVRTIVLGTCSTGGTCVYHENARNFQLKIILDGTKEVVSSK